MIKWMVALLGVVLGSASAIGEPCIKWQHKGGVDFSLPCYWHNPIPAEDAAIGFAPGSAELSIEAKAILDRQAAALASFPGDLIELVGHADTVEAVTASQQAALGRRRAEAAREHLIGQGIVPNRIIASGSDVPIMIPRQVTPENLERMRVVVTRVGSR